MEKLVYSCFLIVLISVGCNKLFTFHRNGPALDFANGPINWRQLLGIVLVKNPNFF